MNQAELVFGIRKEFRNNLREAFEIISDKEKHPMKPTVDEVLKDFNPEGLGFFTIQNPETKDMFKTFEINIQSNIDGDVLEVAGFWVSKFSQ